MSGISVDSKKDITIIQPTDEVKDLESFCLQERGEIRKLLEQNCAILLKGFPIYQSSDFSNLISYLGLAPWSAPAWKSFNFGSEAFSLWYMNNILDYFNSRVLAINNPRKANDLYNLELPPSQRNIQIPHVEYGLFNERPMYLALHCKQTEPNTAQTALYDNNKAFEKLDEMAKTKYGSAFHEYNVKSDPIAWYLRVTSKLIYRKPYYTMSTHADKSITLHHEKVPFVVSHPIKQVPCVQPFPFASNVYMPSYEAAKESLQNRNFEISEARSNDANTCYLYSDTGDRLTWDDEELKELYKALFNTGMFLQWEPHDVLIFDNLYFSHGRMEGDPAEKRVVNQIALNGINVEKYKYK